MCIHMYIPGLRDHNTGNHGGPVYLLGNKFQRSLDAGIGLSTSSTRHLGCHVNCFMRLLKATVGLNIDVGRSMLVLLFLLEVVE